MFFGGSTSFRALSVEFQNSTHLVVSQEIKEVFMGTRANRKAGLKTVSMHIKTWRVPYGKLCLNERDVNRAARLPATNFFAPRRSSTFFPSGSGFCFDPVLSATWQGQNASRGPSVLDCDLSEGLD